MASAIPSALVPDSSFHGRYRVVRCLSAGGMGAVYEVLDTKTDGRRALKTMLPNLVEDPDMRARFEREARVTGGIESDHLVRVSDAGVDDETGTPFIVMEMLRGEDFSDVLRGRGQMSPREAIVYLSQVGRALDKTHAAGIVHRDLKPQNLFLTTRDDGSPCVKILDFGIAKVIAKGGKTRATRSLGTPTYMAPEQVLGDGKIGPAADVYALGQIAYALLVGEPYWQAEADKIESDYAFCSRIVDGLREKATARALERRGVALPAGFDAWFERACARLPDVRFETASAAVTELAAALGTAGPEASPSMLPRPSEVATRRDADVGFRDTVSVDDVLPPKEGTRTGFTREPSASPRARSRLTAGIIAGVAVAAFVTWRAFSMGETPKPPPPATTELQPAQPGPPDPAPPAAPAMPSATPEPRVEPAAPSSSAAPPTSAAPKRASPPGEAPHLSPTPTSTPRSAATAAPTTARPHGLF